MGSTPAFAGTRVPVQTRVEYIQAGDRITNLMDEFPTVTREQIIAFLQQGKDRVLGTARERDTSSGRAASSRPVLPAAGPARSGADPARRTIPSA